MSLARHDREDSDRYKNVCVQAVDAIFLVDPESKRVLDANVYAVDLTGYPRDELVGASIYKLRPEEERPRLDAGYKELEETGEVRSVTDTHILRRDQRVIPVELNSKIIKINGERVAMTIVRDISERKRVEAELAEQTEDLEILNQIALGLASGLELDETLRRVMRYAVELTGADAGAIAVIDPSTGFISYPFVANLAPRVFEKIRQRGGGLAGQIVETKKPTIVRDYPYYPGAIQEFIDAGVVEIAAAPLISKEVSFGALGVFMMSRERHFSERNLRLLEGVGRLAGVALENARLFAVERRERVTLGILESISHAALTMLDVNRLLQEIVAIIVDRMDIRCGSILLVDEGWLVVRATTGLGALRLGERIRFGEGFVGQVASSGRVIAVSDTQGYPLLPEETPERPGKAMIGIPLKIRGQIIGMARFDISERHDFKRDEIRLFSALADRAAAAIENTRLFESEKRRAEETAALMHLTSDLLSILDIREFLHHVAEQAVELVDAELGFVPVISGIKRLEIAEAFSTEQGWKPASVQWSARRDVPGYVLETGEMIVVDDAKKSPLTDKEIVLKLGIRNLIAAPIITRSGDFIAVVVAANKRGATPFSARDSELIRAIVGQAAVGVENAKLYEDQRHIAQTLQKSLLPERLPDIPNTELGVSYTSATSAATVGGDFYDVIELPDGRTAFLIGDVSGKGVEAATTSAMTRFLTKALVFENPNPADLMRQVNEVLYRQTQPEEFVTIFFGVFEPETGRLVYANAGHPPPFTCGPVACMALEERREIVSGAFPHVAYTNSEIEFAPGNGLVMYTDGLTEARRGSDFLGERRVQKIIAENATASAQELASLLFREARKFSGGRLADDIAIVVIKRGW